MITGVAGLIGSWLAEFLLEAGAKVDGVDNFITGQEKNLTDLLVNSNFSFTFADVITNPESWLPNADYDVVFHFASPASPPRYQKFPVETYQVNAQATHQLLQYIHQHSPTTRFIFAGTSEVYGDPEVHPQPETYYGNVNPNGPRSCYDEAKRMAETICGVFHRDFGIDTRIVRIFNTYGPRINPADGRVVPNFVMQALQGRPLTIYGDGTQTRSFCYISDLVAGILRLASLPNLEGETINIGNPSEITIKETAELIKKLTKSKSEITVSAPLPKNDPLQRRPDISKAKKLLNWEPSVDLETGLQRTIVYFSNNL